MRKVTEIQHEYSYEAVEKLDELITIGMMCAKQECRNNVRLPWSKDIHEKMTQVNILRLHMSSLQNKVDCTDQIEKKQQTLKVQQTLPPTVKETTETLKAAQGGSKTGTKIVERISIQTNNSIEGSGRSTHCQSAQYVPLASS